jgi:hypothetical protein
MPAGETWRRTLRTGLFWTALGLGASSISYACDANLAAESLGFSRVVALAFLSLVPIPALALGVRGLALALRMRTAAGVAERIAADLEERLPESHLVVTNYAPRDAREDAIAIVVIAPSTITIVEPRESRGEVACYNDQWYRTPLPGVRRRLAGPSPSQRARLNASRLRRDLARSGFAHARVEPVVLFTQAELGDVAGTSVPAVAGVDALVARLEETDRMSSPSRTRAVAEVLAGRFNLAAV